jgi:hypothetical protein
MVIMRCDEVTRELAVPTEDRDRTALAEHLAGCPSCAAWSHRAALLDQLWDATRPAQPSPEAWDSIWANINQALSSPAADRELAAMHSSSRPDTPSKVFIHSGPAHTQPANRPRTRRIVTIALIGLAQAAAILIAVGLAWHGRPGPAKQQNPQVARNPIPAPPRGPQAIRVSQAVIVAEIDIEEGHQIMIRVDGSESKLVDVTPPEMFYGGIVNNTRGSVEMFNAVESFSKTVVAAQ